jgi:prepilin-type N-terminal cleavage/methylation domain-containing protein
MLRGLSLLELLVVLAIFASILATLVPVTGPVLDRLAVSQSVTDIATVVSVARWSAVAHGSTVRIQFSQDSLVAVFEGASDSVFLTLPGPARRGVRLAVSRPVIRFWPNGTGFGAANTTLVLTRGRAADSLAVSRLGRVRRIR